MCVLHVGVKFLLYIQTVGRQTDRQTHLRQRENLMGEMTQ